MPRIYLLLILSLLALGGYWFLTTGTAPTVSKPSLPNPPVPLETPPVPPAPNRPEIGPPSASVELKIAHDEIATQVVAEVERALRPQHAAFAIYSANGKRLGCLLVESNDYFYRLDAGLKKERFPVLLAKPFKEPPEPMARTFSTYRSLAKRGMQYDSRGMDRLIILACPAADWASLRLEYLGPTPDEKPDAEALEF